MKVQVLVGKEWRDAEAVIRDGRAIVTLPHPYGTREFSQWRNPKTKQKGKANVRNRDGITGRSPKKKQRVGSVS